MRIIKIAYSRHGLVKLCININTLNFKFKKKFIYKISPSFFHVDASSPLVVRRSE